MRRVRLGDGIRFDLTSGETVVCDGERPGDCDGVRVLSHAHGDHLYRDDPGAVICSDVTAALARVRREDTPLERTTHPAVELLDAGHVPGSSATRITDPDGTRYLYTGDLSIRDRFYLEGFEPVDADVLVIEATYGEPAYVLPPQETVEREIVGWLDETYDRPVLAFGYTLGRAQELQLLANRSSRERLFVTRATARINGVIEEHYDVEFGARRYRESTELGAGDVLVLPTQTNRLSFVDALVRDRRAIKAGFSGWAIDDAFKYRGDYDATFPLSDHCDFAELLEVVRAVDPEVVYTQHGSAEALATHLTREEGYEAYPLVRNQRSLSDF